MFFGERLTLDAGKNHDELNGPSTEILAVMQFVHRLGEALAGGVAVAAVKCLDGERAGYDVGVALDRVRMPSSIFAGRNLNFEHRRLGFVGLRVGERLSRRRRRGSQDLGDLHGRRIGKLVGARAGLRAGDHRCGDGNQAEEDSLGHRHLASNDSNVTAVVIRVAGRLLIGPKFRVQKPG